MFDLYAEFRIKDPMYEYGPEVDIDLEFVNDKGELFEYAVEAFKDEHQIETDRESIDILSIFSHTQSSVLKSLSQSTDWKEIYRSNFNFIVSFFEDLQDDDERIIALWLHTNQNVPLDRAISEASCEDGVDGTWLILRDRDAVFEHAIAGLEIDEALIPYLDINGVIEEFAPIQFRFSDGRFLV